MPTWSTHRLAERVRYSIGGDRNREVDFVVRAGKRIVAIEVKGGHARYALPGMTAFAQAFRPTRKLLVGGDGLAVEAFLSMPIEDWLLS